MKTIFHIDEPEKWEMAVANVENLAAYCREKGVDCEIEVVANGAAVRGLTRIEAVRLGLEGPLKALKDAGAVIAACGNSLVGLGISGEALCPWVTVVPAGVAELTLKQEAGFAYIKP